LFTIYINDLPDVIENMVKLFANDTKVYATVSNTDERDSLQSDIDRLMNWSDTWLLKFSKSKCKHTHLGSETGTSYSMLDDTIDLSNEEKDRGITIDSKLNFQQHINIQVKKANKKLGIINRTFNYMDKEIFLVLYKSLVRPHLEYGSVVLSVINKKKRQYNVLIENVERRATRLVKEIQHLSYGDRLRNLGLPTLQYRRIRADLVETCKIINKVDCTNIFPIRKTNTRGHKHKIFKKH
jgi:hypothetical protein